MGPSGVGEQLGWGGRSPAFSAVRSDLHTRALHKTTVRVKAPYEEEIWDFFALYQPSPKKTHKKQNQQGRGNRSEGTLGLPQPVHGHRRGCAHGLFRYAACLWGSDGKLGSPAHPAHFSICSPPLPLHSPSTPVSLPVRPLSSPLGHLRGEVLLLELCELLGPRCGSHPGHGRYSTCRSRRPRTAGLLNLHLLA